MSERASALVRAYPTTQKLRDLKIKLGYVGERKKHGVELNKTRTMRDLEFLKTYYSVQMCACVRTCVLSK